MKLAVAAVLSFVVQWILGMPVFPAWAQGVLLPMVWVVGPPMRHRTQHVFLTGLGLGLTWDLLFEPIVGPGAIAWSAAALIVAWTVRRVGKHSVLSWGLLGAGGTVLVAGFRFLALIPLGRAVPPPLVQIAAGTAGTGLLCAVAVLILGMDLSGRVRRYRRGRLR